MIEVDDRSAKRLVGKDSVTTGQDGVGGALLISTLITQRGVGTYSDWTYREGSYHFSKPGFGLVKDSFLVTVYPIQLL